MVTPKKAADPKKTPTKKQAVASKKTATTKQLTKKYLTQEQILAAKDDDYMNEAQLAFFKQMLLEEKGQILAHLGEAKHDLSSVEKEFDELDQALEEQENSLRLRLAERESKLLQKINSSLERIEKGTYGFCAVTGNPIGIKRLIARPTASLCTEEKTRQEQIGRNFAE